jgi:hypothetical protein
MNQVEIKRKFETLMRSPDNYVNYIEKTIDLEHKRKMKKESYIPKPKLPNFSPKASLNNTDEKKSQASAKHSGAVKAPGGKEYINFDDFLISRKNSGSIQHYSGLGKRNTSHPLLDKSRASPKTLTTTPMSKKFGESAFSLQKSIENKDFFFLDFRKNATPLKLEPMRKSMKLSQIATTTKTSWDYRSVTETSEKPRSNNISEFKNNTPKNLSLDVNKINESLIRITGIKEANREILAYRPIDELMAEEKKSLEIASPKNDYEFSKDFSSAEKDNILSGQTAIDISGFKKRIKKIFTSMEIPPFKVELQKRQPLMVKRRKDINTTESFNDFETPCLNDSKPTYSEAKPTKSFFIEKNSIENEAMNRSELRKKSKSDIITENNKKIKTLIDRLLSMIRSVVNSQKESKSSKLENFIMNVLPPSVNTTKNITAKEFLKLHSISTKVFNQLGRDAEFMDSLKFYSEEPITSNSHILFKNFVASSSK